MPSIVVGRPISTSCTMPAGIHSARERGSTHTRSSMRIVTSPCEAHANWWVSWRWRWKRCPGGSSKRSTTMPPPCCPIGDIGCHATPSTSPLGDRTVEDMNQAHLEALASEEWRQTLRERALPFAFGELTVADLGDDVLEIGPGPGLTTELLAPQVPHLTSVEIDPALATSLAER